MNWIDTYNTVRKRTEDICRPLETEDYVVQPVVDVSPPKWHIGHTTWFFETFLLKPHLPGYTEFNPDFNYVFNSYYETVGARVIRTDRGNLSRPTVKAVYSYRKYVDEAMDLLLLHNNSSQIHELVTLGLNHEEQHQELLITDIKYILGHNPLFPIYFDGEIERLPLAKPGGFIAIDAGIYNIGSTGAGFCFDNELGRHKVYLEPFKIASQPVSNGEYLEFMQAGGYKNFNLWHAEGLDWIRTHKIEAPMYWHKVKDNWLYFTMHGLQPLDLSEPLNHVSFYEAAAYAAWKEMRLPTEFEWEAASDRFSWGKRWEWTESAYLPYPGFKKAPGALGEYNGKFMVNQKVLRGASEATSPGHSRKTYRNFFHPHLRWQYTGIRLAQ